MSNTINLYGEVNPGPTHDPNRSSSSPFLKKQTSKEKKSKYNPPPEYEEKIYYGKSHFGRCQLLFLMCEAPLICFLFCGFLGYLILIGWNSYVFHELWVSVPHDQLKPKYDHGIFSVSVVFYFVAMIFGVVTFSAGFCLVIISAFSIVRKFWKCVNIGVCSCCCFITISLTLTYFCGLTSTIFPLFQTIVYDKKEGSFDDVDDVLIGMVVFTLVFGSCCFIPCVIMVHLHCYCGWLSRRIDKKISNRDYVAIN